MNEEFEHYGIHIYLNQAREARIHLVRLEGRKKNLQLLLTDTAVHISENPHAESTDKQRDQAIHAEIDMIERKIKEIKEEIETLKKEIGMTICRISDPISQTILIKYYLEYKSWQEIAEALNYSRSQIYRYRDAGYEELKRCNMNEPPWNIHATSMEHP